MRDQLRKFDGQVIVANGRVGSHCQRGKYYDTVLQDVSVREYRPDIPQLSVPAEVVDHLWLLRPKKIRPVGMKVVLMGKVYYYTRADGSLDLSIDPFPCADLKQTFETTYERAMRIDDQGQRENLFLYMSNFLKEQSKNKRLFYSSADQSLNEVTEMIHNAADRVLHQRELNTAAHLSSWAARIQRSNAPTSKPCIPFL